eukprot:2642961-Lingulodinium_polyedra.AAC.1
MSRWGSSSKIAARSSKAHFGCPVASRFFFFCGARDARGASSRQPVVFGQWRVGMMMAAGRFAGGRVG